MIDLYTSPTPNGWKAAMMLEELALDYVVKHVEPEFLEMNPNGRIPVIVDHEADGLTAFDSNAILVYLAEKTGRLLPADGPRATM
jgi:GST-like protein